MSHAAPKSSLAPSRPRPRPAPRAPLANGWDPVWAAAARRGRTHVPDTGENSRGERPPSYERERQHLRADRGRARAKGDDKWILLKYG